MKKIFLLNILLLGVLLLVSACVTDNDNDFNENLTDDVDNITDIEDNTTIIIDNTNNDVDDVNNGVINGVDNGVVNDMTSVERLLMAGRPVRCVYEEETDDGFMSYEILIADEKFRMHTIISDDEVHDSFMINDGEYIYIWGSQMNEGIKYEVAMHDEGITYDDETTTNTTEEFPYSCSEWSQTPNAFQPPSDVTFMDFSLIWDTT